MASGDSIYSKFNIRWMLVCFYICLKLPFLKEMLHLTFLIIFSSVIMERVLIQIFSVDMQIFLFAAGSNQEEIHGSS